MFRFVWMAFVGCLLASANAHAGIGGTWVMEYLLCMESAESAGVPREQARMQCGQTLAESGGRAEEDSTSQLDPYGNAQVMEYVLCRERAESAGLLREEARTLCFLSVAELGSQAWE